MLMISFDRRQKSLTHYGLSSPLMHALANSDLDRVLLDTFLIVRVRIPLEHNLFWCGYCKLICFGLWRFAQENPFYYGVHYENSFPVFPSSSSFRVETWFSLWLLI
jgi:hypothetical protein